MGHFLFLILLFLYASKEADTHAYVETADGFAYTLSKQGISQWFESGLI